MPQENLAEILGESFWNGWIPSDLDPELLEALELSDKGEEALQELQDVISSWQYSVMCGRSNGAINQVEGLRESLEEAHRCAMEVPSHEHEAIANLLLALQEGLKAMVNSCTAVLTGMQLNDMSLMHVGLHCAEQGAKVLRFVHDGTHYNPEAGEY